MVTGGAGFIGSHVAERLAADGVEVVVYDDFSTGRPEFLEGLRGSPGARGRARATSWTATPCARRCAGCDVVFHLAANADVRFGLEDPSRDFRQNTQGTFSVLEAMRATGARRIVFSSTGSVYGEPEVFPTPEDCPFPVQTSLYGASKLAGEGADPGLLRGLRLLGRDLPLRLDPGRALHPRAPVRLHRALRRDPSALTVLGDGRQRKSYLYVGDCVEAVTMLARAAPASPASGSTTWAPTRSTVVDDSVAAICEHMGIAPEITHTGGERGWVGDSPLIHLDCAPPAGPGLAAHA